MKIRTQLITSAAIFAAILLACLITEIMGNQSLQQIAVQKELARSLQQDTNELSFLTNSYLLFHDRSQLTLWQSKVESISKDLSTLAASNQQQQNLIDDMRSNQQRMLAVFTEIKTSISNNPAATDNLDYIGTAYSRLAVQNQGIIADANQLSLLLSTQSDQIQQSNSQIILFLFVAFGLLIIANFMLINRRIVGSLSRLLTGAKIIGSGNLDHVVAVKDRDEFGELSAAFNQMTSDLKSVTASKTELEKEIAKRIEVQEKLRVSNEQLQYQTLKLEEEIKERKKTEAQIQLLLVTIQREKERLSALVNSIPDEVWFADAEANFRLVNPVAVREFGADFLKDSEVENIALKTEVYRIDGTIRPVEEAPPLRALKGEIIKNQEEIVRIPATGELRYRQVNAVPVKDIDGNIIGSVSVVHDITERKKIEESLQKYTRELEAANKELETFSYSVSHDLRAPLRTLGGFSEMMMEDCGDKLDETGKDYLERIRTASQTMSELIDAILKLSRISRAEMHQDRVDLSDLAKSILEVLKQSQPERQAEIIIESELLVKGDLALVRVALNNLLENAWKYTRKCAVTRIEVGCRYQENERVYFVKDNGVGFDMRFKDKLFQPFQRLHSGNDYPGTGIGLATVQRVIRRHNGRIWAESEVGRGTTFYFTLD